MASAFTGCVFYGEFQLRRTSCASELTKVQTETEGHKEKLFRQSRNPQTSNEFKLYMWGMRKSIEVDSSCPASSASSYPFNTCLIQLEDTRRKVLLASGNNTEDDVTETT